MLSKLAERNETFKLEHLEIGEPRTIQHLRHVLRDINPYVVFFIETKLNASRITTIRKCGFRDGIDVDSDRKIGGLSLGWNESCKITLQSFSMRHVDVLVKEEGEGQWWRCIGSYRASEERF